MKRTTILLAMLAMLGVMVMPGAAGAKGQMNRPPTCDEIVDAVAVYDIDVAHAPDYFDLDATTLLAREWSDLCVEATVVDDLDPDTDVIVKSLNVALIDYENPVGARERCGFYGPTKRLSEGSIFDVGFSLDGFDGDPYFCETPEDEFDVNGGDLTLMVWTVLSRKSDPATLRVKVGFGTITP